jgi:Protein of unknown function (DUF4058)
MPMHDWTRVDDGIYHDFHNSWIAGLWQVLNCGALPSGYYALSEQLAGSVGPDVITLHQPDREDSDDKSGGIAVAIEPPRVELTATSERNAYLARRKTIVIRHRSGKRIVAMIEILSPGNKKTRRQLGRFVRKAVAVISRGIHLLVIDPFPPSKRDPNGIHGAIWAELDGDDYRQPADRPLTLASYSASETTSAFVQTLSVGQLLVDMPLFLTPEYYVHVKLEEAYAIAWHGTPGEIRRQLID